MLAACCLAYGGSFKSMYMSQLGVMKVFGSVQSAGATSVVLTIDEVGPLGGSGTTESVAAAPMDDIANGTMIYERSHYKFYKEKNEVFDEGKYVHYTKPQYIIRPP